MESNLGHSSGGLTPSGLRNGHVKSDGNRYIRSRAVKERTHKLSTSAIELHTEAVLCTSYFWYVEVTPVLLETSQLSVQFKISVSRTQMKFCILYFMGVDELRVNISCYLNNLFFNRQSMLE